MNDLRQSARKPGTLMTNGPRAVRAHRTAAPPAFGRKAFLSSPLARIHPDCEELSKRKGCFPMTKHMEIDVGVVRSGEQRMKLQYGVNQADQCSDFAMGPDRERIWARLREIDTRIVRLFLFDKGAPDHLKQWDLFAAYVQAVLNIGAKPMM